MKKKLFLLSILATVTMTSCKKEVDAPAAVDSNTKISISAGEYGSRSIETSYAGNNATFLPIMQITKYSLPLVAGELSPSATTIGDPQALMFMDGGETWTALANLTTASKSIALRANFDGQTVGTTVLSNNVNTRQGFDKVQMYGLGDVLKNVTGGNSTAAVNLTPEMARLEITSKVPMVSSGTSSRTNIKITAIYLNNTKLTRGDATKLDKTISDVSLWNAAYGTTGTKSKLYDTGSWAELPVANLFADKTVGYNIFPQAGVTGVITDKDAITAAKAAHPHLVFKIDYNDGVSIVRNQYLTISHFTTTTTTPPIVKAFVSDFKKGTVYQFDINDIYRLIEDGAEVSPVPDPVDTDVTITVTVSPWVAVAVNPEV